MSTNTVRLIGGLALGCVIGLVGLVNENLASVVKSGERKSSELKHRDHKAKGSEVPSAVYSDLVMIGGIDVGTVKKMASQSRQKVRQQQPRVGGAGMECDDGGRDRAA